MKRKVKVRTLRTYRFLRSNFFDLVVCIVIAMVLVLLSSGAAFAQNVGINNATPHAKALLDMTSTDKGVLVPRMTEAQRIAMFPAADATAKGMLVYQTDGTQGFYYFDGAVWVHMDPTGGPATAGWETTGNAGTDPATNFIGTTDSKTFVVRTNNLERMRVAANGNMAIGAAVDPVNYRLYLENDNVYPGLLMRNMSTTGYAGLHVQNNTGMVRSHFGVGNTAAPSLVNIGYAGTTTAHPFVLTTSDQERLRVTTDGDVGIGVTAPLHGLHVIRNTTTGTLGLRNLNNNAVSGVNYYGSGGTLGGVTGWSNNGNAIAPGTLLHGTVTDMPATFITNSIERMRITNAGRIGIGTTAPTCRFELIDDSWLIPMRVRSTHAQGYSVTQYFNAANNGGGHVGMVNPGAATHSNNFIMGSFSSTPVSITSNDVERIRITPAGLVGVNTSTPTAQFDVLRNSGTGAGQIHLTENELDFARLGFRNTVSTKFWEIAAIANDDDSQMMMNFFHSTNANLMTLRGTGKLGIGHYDPQSKLHVRVSDPGYVPNVQSGITVESTGNVYSSILSSAGETGVLFGASGNAQAGGIIFNNASVPNGMILRTNGNVDRVAINNQGNVGIGTNTPTTKLEVNGFTKLGSDAPAVKMKKYTGTTAATQGGSVDLVHGLTTSKILSVTVLIEYQSGIWIPTSYSNVPGYSANFLVNATAVRVINETGNSASILNKPMKILITYEE
jgi:hypothetical protein